MAEINATRGDYRFAYDEPERDLQLDLPHLFGKDLAANVIMDGEGDFKNSTTIEEFLRQARKYFKKYDNLLLGLDSFDTLVFNNQFFHLLSTTNLHLLLTDPPQQR